MSGSRDHLLDSAYNDLCEGISTVFYAESRHAVLMTGGCVSGRALVS